MTLDDGRTVVNWREADWRPYPALGGGRADILWHPIRAAGSDGGGFYLMKLEPGAGGRLHRHDALETFIVLEGGLVDEDGRVLGPGDCVAYQPGTRHQTRAPEGVTMVVWSAGPISTVESESAEAIEAGRRVANWHEADFVLYPALPETADPIYWRDICGNPETGEGFYIVKFPPGASSASHEHMGPEHFIILEGELSDCDGATYRTGDCVALEPGTVHDSRSGPGCITAAFIGGRLRTLV